MRFLFFEEKLAFPGSNQKVASFFLSIKKTVTNKCYGFSTEDGT